MNAAEPMIFTQVVMFVKLIQDLKIVAHNKKIIQAVTNAELIQEDSNVASRIQNIQVAMFVNYLQEVNYVVMLIQKMSHVYNA
jgi:3-methyladenine DNA glycosylase Tag